MKGGDIACCGTEGSLSAGGGERVKLGEELIDLIFLFVGLVFASSFTTTHVCLLREGAKQESVLRLRLRRLRACH